MAGWLDYYSNAPVEGLMQGPFNPAANLAAQQQAAQQAYAQMAQQALLKQERDRQIAALHGPAFQQMLTDVSAPVPLGMQPQLGTQPQITPLSGGANQLLGSVPDAPGQEFPLGARGQPGSVSVSVGEPQLISRNGVQLSAPLSEPQMQESGSPWRSPFSYVEIPDSQKREDLPGPMQGLGQLGRAAPARGPQTPEEFALMQHLMPQLTQRRVAEEQSRSADARRFADIDAQQRRLTQVLAEKMWETERNGLVKLKSAQMAAHAKAGPKAAKDPILQDIDRAAQRTVGELQSVTQAMATAQVNFSVSNSPSDKAYYDQLQAKRDQLAAAADMLNEQYTLYLNRQHSITVPNRTGEAPKPAAPSGAPATPERGGTSVTKQQLDKLQEDFLNSLK